MSEQLIIGRYSKGREIGVGGMGTVYLGTDTLTSERVAIKELKPEVVKDDPDIVERFAREAEALRKLNHPSIVKVLATGSEADRQYIVMEYVDGGSLSDKLEETRQLPIREILDIALDLSDALARAHRLHIIHRDIKPANVLIAADGTPRLTDFGVARIGDTTRLTKTGVVVGTLSYLAPEAINSEPLDERADLWAFGVMLYEMLAGVRPFEGETPGALLMGILRNPTPDILQYRAYDDIGSWGLPGLIYWLLEKERDKRPQSARLVGAVLENLLSGKEMPMNWFGDESGMYDDTPISLPPEKTATAIREYTTSSLFLADLVSKHDELSEVDPVISTAKTVVDAATPVPIPQKAPQPLSRARQMQLIGVVLLLIVIGLGSVFLRLVGDDTPPASSITIAPVAAGEYMVLIAEPEHIEGEERDVQRFIADDLRFNLEDVQLSRIRIRTYPAVVRTADEAQRVADEANAHLILWGNYDSDRVEINVQMGDWEQYPKLVFPHDEVNAIVNARYQMANERQETLSFGVVAALNALIPMSNIVWDMTLNLAILERIDEPSAVVQGNHTGALFHRYLIYFLDDTETAVRYLDDAIRNDPNGLLYVARALGYARLGNAVASRQDIQTAQQLSPSPNWIYPQFMLANDLIYFQNDFAGALLYTDTILEQVQDDWFFWAYRATLNYLVGNYEAQALDIEEALARNPQANFVYMTAVAVSQRQGDFEKALSLLKTVLQKFPDPDFIERILLVTYNPQVAETVLPRYVSSFGNFTLRRWQAVIDETQAILDDGVGNLTDIYLLQGFSYCNLGEDAAAEAAYTAGIELEPGYMMLYFVRAEVRRNQGNLIGAAQDIAAVLASPQADRYRPLITASTEGEMSCRTFLDMDLDALRSAEATAESTTESNP